MINFTNDEQITILAIATVVIEDLTETLENGTNHCKSSYERIAEHQISCLHSIREKINKERKRQGRIEL